MRLIIASGLAAVSALALATASAQTVSGTLNLTGTVPTKCSVTGGNSTTYALGDLSGADGRLSSVLGGYTSGTTPATFSFTVTCTGAAPMASVDADPVVSATAAASGFTNRVDFTGEGSFALVSGGPDVHTNLSTAAAASTSTALTARLANAANNVTIRAYAFFTQNPTDILVAATDYAGKVVVTIAPGV